MAKRPEDRYARRAELAEEVQRWLADEPVSAYREPLRPGCAAGRGGTGTAGRGGGGARWSTAVRRPCPSARVLINRERAKAEANFRQARAAVDEYFTTVSESKLLNVPGLQPLRKELLDAAQRVLPRLPPRARRRPVGAGRGRLGLVPRRLDRHGDRSAGRGPRALRTATAIYEELARAHPGDVEYRRLAATGHGALGLLLSGIDRPDEAMAAHRRALAIREALAKDVPGNPRPERPRADPSQHRRPPSPGRQDGRGPGRVGPGPRHRPGRCSARPLPGAAAGPT